MSRAAIVTGAGRGLGAATAGALAEDGLAVLVTDVNEEAAAEVATRLAEVGRRVEAARLDVADPDDWSAAVPRACALGDLRVLVNNGAAFSSATVEEETLEGWNHVLEVNLTGAFLGIRAVIPAMTEAGGGSIVNVASAWAHVAHASDAAYHASKGGLVALTRNAAVTYAERGIRVNAVSPGNIATPANEEAQVAGAVEHVRSLTPMGRDADPAEVAAVIRFLSGDASSYITGAVLTVDGGYSIA